MRGTEDFFEQDDNEVDEAPLLGRGRRQDLVRARAHRRPERPKADAHPILVVCYTNHALDQFLEGIHEFHQEGIVRVGGRSQSETMQKCSLRELKYKMHKNQEGTLMSILEIRPLST